MSIKNDSWSCSSSDTYKYRRTDSGSTKPVAEGSKAANAEGFEMSFAYVCCHGDTVYMAADSRNTITISSLDQNFQNRRYEDNYQKIVVNKKLNLAVISTGTNDFDGSTLQQIINSKGSSYDICEAIKETSYYMVEIKANKLYSSSGNGKTAIVKKDSFWYSGDKTIVSIADKIPMPADGDDKDFVCFLNKMFSIATTVSELTNKTVGGKIHILKITTDGFTWLQNGYEL